MPSPLADITRFLGGYRQGQLEAEDRDYLRQKRAMEEEDRAAIMRETGYSPSVLNAQKVRMDMERMKEEAETRRIANISGKAGRLVAMGDTAGANQTLRSGGLDAVQIDDDPEDPGYVHFTTKVGKYRVPRITGAMIAQNPLEYARSEMSLDRMLAQQEARAQASMQALEQRGSQASKLQAQRDEAAWKRALLRAQSAGRSGGAGGGGARMALIGARAENIRQANPSIDRVSAWNQAYEESILGQGRVSNAVKVAMDALKAQLRVYSDNGDEAGIESTLKSMRELSNRLRGSAPARAPQAPKHDNLPPRPWEKRK